jgi:hypothetical protein
VLGGSVQRIANRATHLGSLGDGLLTMVCGIHAEMFARGSGFAIPIDALEGFVCAEMTDSEARQSLQWVTYDRREGLRQAERDARTVQIKVQVEDVTDRALPPGGHE